MARKMGLTAAKSSAARNATTVYRFKVELHYDEPIWRRIEIRGDQTLDDLHESIFAALDREEEHLYSFYFPRPGYLSRKAMREAPEYTHPANVEDLFPLPFEAPERIDAAKTTIAALGLTLRQRFLYMFDFGDEWWHTIRVEKVDLSVEQGRYPRIVEKHGASPPQYEVWAAGGEEEDGDKDE